MNLEQNEIKMVLNWILEIENRIFSIEELGLIEKLMKNHIEINKSIQIEEMRNEIKEMIKSLDRR